jgi:hypothetical protein
LGKESCVCCAGTRLWCVSCLIPSVQMLVARSDL